MKTEGSQSPSPFENDPIPGEPSQLTQLRKIFDVVMKKENKTPEDFTLFSALQDTISEAEQNLEMNPTLSSQTGEKVYKLFEENKHLIQQ